MVERAVEVRVLRSIAELEDIRPYWESWPGNRDSDLGFYLTVLRESRESLRPHVIVVCRNGQPDAIFVGRLDHRPLDRVRVGYIHVRPQVTVLYFVYGALRGNSSAENCELIIRQICASLSQREADLAYLNYLGEDSHIYELAKKMPGFLCRDRICESQLHFSRKLPRSLEEFYGSLSPNARWQAKSKQKKLAKAFGSAARVRCFQEPAELDNLFRDAEVVAKSSYQRGLGVGFADTPEERRRLDFKAEKGWLRAYILYIEDRPSAFWIGDLNEGVFGSEYLGFDTTFAKYSPGMCLILKVIEGFCEGGENVSGIDFASGQAQYKETLSDRVWRETSVFIFGPSLRGIALNLVKTSAVGIDHALKNVLERTGLLQKIKKSWRGRLSNHKQSA